MSTSDRNKSTTLTVFPASRRDVMYYNSRIMSEDNYRRSIQVGAPVVGGSSVERGTVIIDYSPDAFTTTDNIKIKYLKVCIAGYYVELRYNTAENSSSLKFINDQFGKQSGTAWLLLKQKQVYGTTFPSNQNNFFELDCKDENEFFIGLGTSDKLEEGWFGAPIIVPANGTDGPGIINPAIDGSGNNPNGDIYKPWFQSSASWAASEYSDKNKIWVDDVYDVPHICVNNKWIPLGAVYKTSRS